MGVCERHACSVQSFRDISQMLCPVYAPVSPYEDLPRTGLSLAVELGLNPSCDDSAVRADCREGKKKKKKKRADEGLISLEVSSATAVLSINGPPVPLGALSTQLNISCLVLYLSGLMARARAA